MTRYAIVSDVHSNLESLQHAFTLIDDADDLVCLGDVVGYGPNPNECVKMIRERAKHAVLGNHDLAAVENFGVEYFNDAARAAIAWTQTVLDETNREWLNALPYELRFPDFLLVHGAPVNYFEYILTNGRRPARSSRPTRRSSSSVTRTSPSTGCSSPTARSGTNTCSSAAS